VVVEPKMADLAHKQVVTDQIQYFQLLHQLVEEALVVVLAHQLPQEEMEAQVVVKEEILEQLVQVTHHQLVHLKEILAE
tara:strand:- start:174 stop:410 length:237 start_codon:yes stop_codon:yes gene_type:complete